MQTGKRWISVPPRIRKSTGTTVRRPAGNFWMERPGFAFSGKRQRTRLIFLHLRSGIRNICSVERKLEMRRIRLLFLFLLLGVFGGGGPLTLVFSNAAMVVETGFAIQILLGAGFLWVCLIAFGAFLNENRRPDSGERAVLADGQEIGISQLREDSSFLASDREYKISTEEGETVRIQIYETEQGWLAGQLWEKQEKEEEELYGPAVREEGLGESAWRRREKAVCYSIKMDGKLFFAETEEAVPGEKIPLLRELLNLPLGR